MNASDPSRRGEAIDKYAVMLQSPSVFHGKVRVSAVLTTSHTERRRDAWNVYVRVGAYTFWPKDTVIQCADVYSFDIETDVYGKDHPYCGMLSDEVMRQVDRALAVSLQLLDQ